MSHNPKTRSKKHDSIPVKLLHEAKGHYVTVETRKKCYYRGILEACTEDSGVQLSKVFITDQRSNETRQCSKVLLKGHQIVWVNMPDILRDCPVLVELGKAYERKEVKNEARTEGKRFYDVGVPDVRFSERRNPYARDRRMPSTSSRSSRRF